MSEAWAALIAALVGFVGVTAGAALSQRSQRDQWLREQKIRAISSFVEDVSLMVDRFRSGLPPSAAERVDWAHALQSGRTTVHLLCDRGTIDALEEVARLAKAIAADPSREALDRAIQALQVLVQLARIDVMRPRRAGTVTTLKQP